MFEYDDEHAVKFIQNHLPMELKKRFADDDLYYILDTICDFYDNLDWLSNDDEAKEEQELTKYIIKQTKSDGIGVFTEDEIRLVLAAEAAYTDTLDIPD